MKERPILFSAPMVRALLAGTKTQTRRIIKPQHLAFFNQDLLRCLAIGTRGLCPMARPATGFGYARHSVTLSAISTSNPAATCTTGQTATAWSLSRGGPASTCPRWASRITLEITSVRVERLQEISIEDAKAEGAWGPDDSIVQKVADYFGTDIFSANPRKAFQMLWESINGPDSWAANPWVWAIEFRRVP